MDSDTDMKNDDEASIRLKKARREWKLQIQKSKNVKGRIVKKRDTESKQRLGVFKVSV